MGEHPVERAFSDKKVSLKKSICHFNDAFISCAEYRFFTDEERVEIANLLNKMMFVAGLDSKDNLFEGFSRTEPETRLFIKGMNLAKERTIRVGSLPDDHRNRIFESIVGCTFDECTKMVGKIGFGGDEDIGFQRNNLSLLNKRSKFLVDERNNRVRVQADQTSKKLMTQEEAQRVIDDIRARLNISVVVDVISKWIEIPEEYFPSYLK